MDSFLEITVCLVYLTFSFASSLMYHAIHHHTAMVRPSASLANKCSNHYVSCVFLCFFLY